MEKTGTREMFVRFLRKQAGYCGVEILGYCVMSNHVRILARVPYHAEGVLDDAELVRRYRILYDVKYVPASAYPFGEVQAMFAEEGERADELRRALLARMGDFAVFMKELKQRFTIWFNAAHENRGSVWSGRFKSALVDDSAASLSRVAVYIDLNSVRAEIVEDPVAYRHSNFGAAIGGDSKVRTGYLGFFQQTRWSDCASGYRMLLYSKGLNAKGASSGRIDTRLGREILKQNGKFEFCESICQKARFMTDGVALVSESFLKSLIDCCQNHFSSKRRP